MEITIIQVRRRGLIARVFGLIYNSIWLAAIIFIISLAAGQ